MSANIIVYHDPTGIIEPEINPVDAGISLLDWLLDNYGVHGFDVPTKIYSEKIHDDSEIRLCNEEVINYTVKENETVLIVHRPQDLATAIAVIVTVLAYVSIPTISPPPIPENPNFPKTSESPNNKLAGQTNVARPLGRIPDVYGRMRVYPDLGAKTVTEYIGHIKFVTEYLVIGRGQYDLTELRSGETLIDDIDGSTSIIYVPGTLIPQLVDITNSNEVNGQEVKAPNSTAVFGASANNVIFNANSTFQSQDPRLSAFESLAIGDTFTITGTPSNDGTYTFASYKRQTFEAQPPDFAGFEQFIIGVTEVTSSETVATLVDFGSTTVLNIVGAFIVPGETDEVWFDIIANRGLADRRFGSSENVIIQLELILDELDSLGNVINTETTTVSISDNVLDERFYTFKIVPANPGGRYQASVKRLTNTINDSAYYDTVKWSRLGGVQRLINFDQGNITSVLLTTQATEQATKSQERKFNVIATRKLRSYDTNTQMITGISPIFVESVQVSFQNGTGVMTVDDNVSPQISALQALQNGDTFTITNTAGGINDGTYTFVSMVLNTTTWTITISELTTVFQLEGSADFAYLGDLTGTTKMADAMLEHLTDPFLGNKDTSEIDLDALYAIQDALDADAIYGSSLGRFSYSFSAEKASVGDELKVIANACRCFVIKKGNSVTFGRDQIQANAVALINTYTKKPKSEKKNVRLHKPNDFDGVELQWQFEDTNTSYIVNVPETPVKNRKKIEAAGIKNFNQAWNRAQIEYKKLELQRNSVETVVTKEGILFNVGSRIRNSDSTDIKTQTGMIKAISGLNIETFDPIDFKGNGTAAVTLRDESGVVEEVTVVPRGDSIDGFTLSGATTITLRVRGDLDYQTGTIYTFALTGEGKIKDYVIQSITPQNQHYAKIKMINYDDLIYAADTTTPPEHETSSLVSVDLDAVPANSIVEDLIVSLATAAVETLAWNAAPSGTYTATPDSDLPSKQRIDIDDLGGWSVTGNGTVFGSGSGSYRPGAVGSDQSNYEIRITASVNSGSGLVSFLGGTSDNVWTPLTGDEGLLVVDSNTGVTDVSVTVEIREIATPANTTGIASFTFNVDGDPPV